MPLTNFGAILTFAVELEETDAAFYEALAVLPAAAPHAGLLSAFAADEKKNRKALVRARQETVTEMTLEPIAGLSRAPFLHRASAAGVTRPHEALAAARRVEDNAADFYRQAAGKLSALPEAARALRSVAKKRRRHLAQLDEITPSQRV